MEASELEIAEAYSRQSYGILGKNQHSAVKVCQWTKESLRTNRTCYKELWYPPVQSHRCMEMTPYLSCDCHCLYCWRLHTSDKPNISQKESHSGIQEFDVPEEILEAAIAERKWLLSGWKGNPHVNRKKWEESLKPSMMTMSLTGEPTLYPLVSELIAEAQKREIITFLVTNGTLPEALENLSPLPFQLYISVSAADKKTYGRIVRPLIRDSWERLNRSLELFPSLGTRRVLRLTMIDGWNMTNHEGYADLVKKSEPNFIEVKAYEWVGQSQRRLPKKAMPYMKDIEDFAERLASLTGYEIKGKYQPSGAVLLA